MKRNYRNSALALGVVFMPLAVQAADIKINGFASVTGGQTLSEGKVPTGKSTYFVDGSTGGTYDDSISFKPDSIYGLQFRSDLGSGLSATGQVVGSGGGDFDAKVKWAYISYEFAGETTLAAGRMRLPLYFYSEYLDVRYAYHWIRGPADTYTLPISEYEGLSLEHQYSLGNWDGRLKLFGGSGDNNLYGFPGEAPFEVNDMIGVAATIGNDWLTLRAIALQQDTNREGDDPSDSQFSGLAAKAQFGNFMAMAEYTRYEFDTPLLAVDAIGVNQGISSYVSLAYTLGALTPHITYSERETNVELIGLGDLDAANDTWTLGVRWDFHPSAALKVEYNSSSDESDSGYTAIAGEQFEVDNVAVGVDVIF